MLSRILVFWVGKHTTWPFCLCLLQPVHLAQISFQVAGFGHTFTLDLELNQLVHSAITLTLTQMLWTPDTWDGLIADSIRISVLCASSIRCFRGILVEEAYANHKCV